MALIEVDSDQLAALQRELVAARPHKQFIDNLAQKPDLRNRLLHLIRDYNPNIAIPELDAAKPVLDEVSALRKELDEEKKARADEKTALQKSLDDEKEAKAAKEREASATAEIDKSRRKLKKDGYTAEAIDKIEKLMEERGLVDYEAATALFDKSLPREEMNVPGDYGRSWNAFDVNDQAEDDKLLVQGKDSWKVWQKGQIKKFFDEKRNGTLKV
jgi:hypothetical protein